MFKNYINIAFRSLWRNKLLSFINIAGLSIGLACVMLIMLFVNDEFSFDRFQQKGDRLFRLTSTSTDSLGKEYVRGITGVPQGPDFATDIPEIENFCRIKGWKRTTKIGSNALQAIVLYADTSFFKMFSFKVLNGNPDRLLDGRNSVVISDAQAKKSFGDVDPIGKTIDIQLEDKFEQFVVSGVVKGAPVNSSIQFDMLVPFEKSMPTDAAARTSMMNDWNSCFLNTFFLLHKGSDPQRVKDKFAQAFLKYNGKNWAEFKKHYGKNVKQVYALQPFLKMHLTSRPGGGNGISYSSDANKSYILTGLGILILLIACVNFINIMLARSAKRNKEIGIRKVSGSSRSQLIHQFLSESSVITAISFLPAISMVWLFLPTFSEIANKHFDIGYLLQLKILLLFLGLWVVVSLSAGFYPAFIASGFNPVQTLYGRFKLSGKNTLGKSLVVFQFVIALTLIICTVVFQQQFDYITKSDKGYKTDNVIRVGLPYGKLSDVQLIKNELALQPTIQMVGAKAGDYNKTVFKIDKKETEWTYYETIDDHYLQLLQIPLVKGRYLSYNYPTDTASACLVNEAFVKTYLDATRSPIGQVISNPSMDKKGVERQVVGVIKNYHLNSYHEKIEPVYLSLAKPGEAENLLIKYWPNRSAESLAAVKKVNKAILPYDMIDYTFLDDWNRQQYSSEEQWKKIITSAAAIAILISCLGLFALTTLATEQRVKEIGIRKVLGASIANITGLLSASFLKLVLVAFVLAAPISWYFMSKWLQDFAYRITLSWWIFLFSAMLTMSLAFITVSYHAITAAIADPAESLRRD